ncbi:MAG: hypothetical protein GXP18_05665 [Gammaproteobacteria bacterium]|nr:hypothetical protein [Gammaproteobacteria bacterium]
MFFLNRLFYNVIILILFLVSGYLYAEEMDHSQHGENNNTSSHGSHDTATSSMHIHHEHGTGGFMFEYKFMRMNMKGLLDGTNNVSSNSISAAQTGSMGPSPGFDYRMSPTKMTMDMHMFMGMYGISEKTSIMGMFHYLNNDMDMVMHMPMGNMFGSMDTSGIGDTRFDVMHQVNHQLTTSLGLSIPTGSINEKITMIMNGTNSSTGAPLPTVVNGPMQAPYPMQLGSGTYDLVPAVTYNKSLDLWNIGGQATYTLRTGENDNQYTLGDQLEITAWGTYSVSQGFTLSSRINILDWGKINGQSPDINPLLSPTADPDATGGTRVDLLFGISGHINKYHMLSLEVGAPVYQDLNGPQLKTDTMYAVSYQYIYGE